MISKIQRIKLRKIILYLLFSANNIFCCCVVVVIIILCIIFHSHDQYSIFDQTNNYLRVIQFVLNAERIFPSKTMSTYVRNVQQYCLRSNIAFGLASRHLSIIRLYLRVYDHRSRIRSNLNIIFKYLDKILLCT